MESLAELIEFADENQITVDWLPMRRAESLSMPLPDGGYGVAIDPAKIHSRADERCKVAHEVGHCMRGAFYNRYSGFDLREKQENRADRWAILHLIPKNELEEAVLSGCTELWSLADRFNVTEEFMKKAICLYTYGNLAVEQYFV